MPSRELLRSETNGPGLALVCSPDAVVTRVLYDGVGLGEHLSEGMVFTSLFGPGNLQRCKEFLQAIRSSRRVDGWRMSISVRGRSIPLSFSAAERGGNLELIGASTPACAEQIRHTLDDLSDHHIRDFASAPVRAIRDAQATSDELTGSIARLQRLNEEKIRWIMAVVHDLLNKVNTVEACAELLAEGASQEPIQRMTIESIQTSADSMARLLQDLEEIARSESKGPWLELAADALLPVLEQSVALSRPEAEKKGIRLRLTCDSEPPMLPIDTPKLVHGFANLLHNSIRYCQNGDDIDVCVFSHKTRVLISIRDSGPGMPEEEVAEMFTPFHQSRMYPVSAEQETGLGLAICKRVIEHHGGHIRVVSKPGQGTAVYVVLPSVSGHQPGGRTPFAFRRGTVSEFD